MANLGRLEKVDLREIWSSESGDFTPWLAQPENLVVLADEIGIELVLEGTEQYVGPFRADIVCKDTLNDTWVLIENQLERTDHNHLGQLLTYAAGLDAVTIVWIAQRFTEEHRAALDWLNSVTEDDINFFGLEIELWRIGNSQVAPKFDIVSKPNNWTRQVKIARRSSELSESKQLHLQYWTAFNNFIDERSQMIKVGRSARPQYWMDFALGRSDMHLSVRNGMRDGYLDVLLYIKGEHPLNYIYQLYDDREAIEKEIGYPLIWDIQHEGRRSQQIVARREEVDTTNSENWQDYHAWQLDLLERFYQVFKERVLTLSADDYVEEIEEED